MKKLLIFLFILFSGFANAQTTAVTGTIVDSDGTTWFNSKVTVTFVPNPNYPQFNQYNINGQQITSNPTWNAMLSQQVTSNSSGQFNVTVLDNNLISPSGSTWKFTIQSYTSAPSATFPNVALTGSSIDVSGFLLTNSVPPRFPATSSQQGGAYGYGTNEISVIPIPGGSFFNITLGVFEVWTCIDNTPCTWVINNSGTLNCSTIQGCGPSYGFSNPTTGQGISDTTLVLVLPVTSYPTTGVIVIDNEWEKYTGISGSNTLTGITRGYNLTTAAVHSNTQVFSVDVPFSPVNQFPIGGVFGYPGQAITAINCPFPSGFPDNGATTVFQVNCGFGATTIDSAGRIHQGAGNSIANFMSPIYIGGPNGDEPSNAGLPIPILNTTNLVQNNNSNDVVPAISFRVGVAGKVKSIPSPTIGALTLIPAFIGSGSCSVTYEAIGTDIDGNSVLGTPTTITGLASSWSFPAGVGIQVPMTAGVVTFNMYRTAVSGCGSLAIGKISSPISAQYPSFSDQYQTGDGTTPPSTNTTVPGQCIGTAANNEAYCELAGTGSTPPVACASLTNNWVYTQTNATIRPFKQVCINGTGWVDLQQNTVGQSATTANPTSITTVNGLVTTTTAGVTQHQTEVLIITTGICTTSTTASSTCTMSPVSWPHAFADTSYSATCTPSAPTTGLQANIYVQKFASAVTITIQNGQGSAAVATTVGEIDCYGVHQ